MKTTTKKTTKVLDPKKAMPRRGKKATVLRYAPGLYLSIRTDSKDHVKRHWSVRYVSPVTGNAREIGLGPASGDPCLTLGEAKREASKVRHIIRIEKRDPLAEREEVEAKAKVQAAKEQADSITFGEIAEAFIEEQRPGWKNETHAAQWESTLETYCKPIWHRSVAKIGTEDIVGILKPIWPTKYVTASRLRGRIERVLDFAAYRKLRSGENPARLRGHLSFELVKPKTKRVKHHTALPWREVPALMAELAGVDGMSARALEIAILTACRTGEVINARWPEFDMKAKVWVVPPERTKTGKQHRVPLSDQSVDVLTKLRPLAKADQHVFPGDIEHTEKAGWFWPLSNMALLMLLRRLRGKDAATTHGFRSSFRDWCADNGKPRELAEAALAHVTGGVEGAYYRSDVIDLRCALMQEWADHVRPKVEATPKVVPLRKKR